MGNVNRLIDSLIESLLPHGTGTITEHRLRLALEQIATAAYAEGENQSLMSLLTIERVAEQIGVSARRMRAIAADRHERFGVGWKVPGARGTWLFRPEEIETLRPDPRFRRPKKED